MVEQIMVFCVGFLLALLVALGALPAFWRRAYRLSRRDVESQLPLSPVEIVAERDQIRATYAVELRRVEQARERAEAERQKGQLLLGQRLATIAARDADLVASKAVIGERDGTIADLQETLAETKGTLHARDRSLDEARAALEGLTEAHETMKAAHRSLVDVADTRRLEIAGLEMQLEAARARSEEQQRVLAEVRAALAARTEDWRLADRQRRDAADRIEGLEKRHMALAEVAEKRARALAEKAEERQALREEVRAARERLSALGRAAALPDSVFNLHDGTPDAADRPITLRAANDAKPMAPAKAEAAIDPPPLLTPALLTPSGTGERKPLIEAGEEGQRSRRAVENVLAAIEAMPASSTP